MPPADCQDASCCATATSCPLNNPPPLVCERLPSRWPLVCQLVVVPPLLLGRRRHSSSRHSASVSCPLNTLPLPQDELPLPHDMPPPLVYWHLSSRLPLYRRLVLTYHLVVPPPFVAILNPCLHSHRLVVVSHLIALLLPTILSSTPPHLDVLATHLLFAYRSPQLIACVFDLVCQFLLGSWLYVMDMPQHIYIQPGGGLYPICPYAEKQKNGLI